MVAGQEDVFEADVEGAVRVRCEGVPAFARDVTGARVVVAYCVFDLLGRGGMCVSYGVVFLVCLVSSTRFFPPVSVLVIGGFCGSTYMHVQNLSIASVPADGGCDDD